MAWYNPKTWKFFGYTDPDTGTYVELDPLLVGRETKSGEFINDRRSMAIPMVWSCVKVLSETVSGLPLKLYEKKGNTRSEVHKTGFESKQVLRLLSRPHPNISRLNFLKAMVVNMALRGNAYAIIVRDSKGNWTGTIPVSSDCAYPDTSDSELGLVYRVTLNGKQTLVSPANMLHFRLFSMDGVNGLSPVQVMDETMGLALAAQNWAARFMQKGGFTGAYIIYKEFLTKEQREAIISKFPDIRRNGADSVGKAAVLEGGPSIIPAGLSQRDSQFIEMRQFTEEEIAGIWGVPLHLTKRASKTSGVGSNLEEQTRAFVMFDIKPYLDAIEDEFKQKLFFESDKYVEFAVEGLLRGNSAGRASYYQAALGGSGGSGWMSQNEVRAKENMAPLEDDKYNQITRWDMKNEPEQI